MELKATNNKQTGLVTNKFGQFILIFMIQEITKYLELLLLCSLRSQSELTATNNKQTGLLCVVLSGTQSWNDFKMNLSIKCLIGKLSYLLPTKSHIYSLDMWFSNGNVIKFESLSQCWWPFRLTCVERTAAVSPSTGQCLNE